MDVSGTGKSSNSSLSVRYNANNEELEQLYNHCDDDPPTPQIDSSSNSQSENGSPKKVDKTSSLIDKYFKRVEKQEKADDIKSESVKIGDDNRSSTALKEVTTSVKDYVNRFGKRGATPEASGEAKEPPYETWKLFHDFKYKITQAVVDMKSRSTEETRDKSVPRENSMSDSEESPVIKDSDQQSIGDTDNQVSSLESSIQNLSELTQPLTAKANEFESSLPLGVKSSECSDSTHRNIECSDASQDLLDDSMMDVESGVEAFEESSIDLMADIIPTELNSNEHKEALDGTLPPSEPLPPNVTKPAIKKTVAKVHFNPEKKTYFFNFLMSLLTIVLLSSYIVLPHCNSWNGFVLGLWVFCFISEFKQFVLDTYFCDWESESFYQVKRNVSISPQYTIPSIKEHKPLKKFEGWINHYRMPEYDPYTYHINKTTTAFMKLEGCNLRISYTRTKVAKRELWDEKLSKVDFFQHRLYNLTGARIILLPKGLVRRRQWSKKYPICIILSEKENIQVFEKEAVVPDKKQSESQTEKKSTVEVETTETNTSPEKKKKFVWRKKDKIIPQIETEPGKEGLRHRLVRKMHRDKKSDSTSLAADLNEVQMDKVNSHLEEASLNESVLELVTKSENNIKDEGMDQEIDDKLVTKSENNIKDEGMDQEIDDKELSRLKDFIEETELETGIEGASEAEWSVHVKQTRDKHSHLYLFARTGRNKHEWFRKLNTAILEADTTSPCDVPTSDEKTTNDGEKDIELAVYKVSEKDTVAFAKPNKSMESVEDTVTITSISQPLQPGDLDSYEKLFWPYLFKIIQTHEISIKRTTEIGVMCQIDPTSGSLKSKKKKKRDQPKAGLDSCACRTLPGEVTWINTMLARVVFDVMRDPVIIQRVQNRIQRKLNTLKLPSFMSPLVVTELQLGGACPLVECVTGPTWDERGVWLDADLRYDGGAHIAILTQINLMKLKEKSADYQLEDPEEHLLEEEVKSALAGNLFADKQMRKRKPAVFDSDAEDSAESSSDDEALPMDSAENIPVSDNVSTNTAEGSSSKNKFLRIVDKIATNKYFQQVTEYKYVKRAMEGISNKDIKLQLEVRGLEGRLALNMPPPPHDRIWFGFRTNPQLILKAKPAFGATSLRFTHISSWIEQKLTKEFEKVLVLPNMEDIMIDVMTPTPVLFE